MKKDKEIALVTGAAGFIGYHLCNKLLSEGWRVCGIDSISNYYDIELKKNRVAALEKNAQFSFNKVNIEDKNSLSKIFGKFNPKIVVHLAAQAGVRYSIEHPQSYLNSNLIGTFNLLEATKEINCTHLLLASTSSVYGSNIASPYKEIDKADTQLSFYAATKKSNEVMSHSYSHLFEIPTTCFRFFTVYGPWGRPDMALFKFTKSAYAKEPIEIYNYGKMKRDFTYIDDLISGITSLIPISPKREQKTDAVVEGDSLSPIAPWRVVNIGSAHPVSLKNFIDVLETKLGFEINKTYVEMQAGDVPETYADISLIKSLTGFLPKVSIDQGIEKFLIWYREYYKING